MSTDTATLPGFTAEAALDRSGAGQRYGGPTVPGRAHGAVVPAAFPLGCYIGEYVHCRMAGAPEAACDDLARKTCLGRMVGADL